jgi:hypothetical protein
MNPALAEALLFIGEEIGKSEKAFLLTAESIFQEVEKKYGNDVRQMVELFARAYYLKKGLDF